MASLNKPVPSLRTAEGGVAKRITPFQELKRTTLACMLWEDGFYESGVSVADRIKALVPQCDPVRVSALAQVAREQFKLRHVPLLLVREMARHKTHTPLVAQTLDLIIQRPDELTEFLAIYWKDGKCPLAASVKKGLAKAFTKFDAYSLAKYNRDGAIKLRDVLFLCHARPLGPDQAETWKQLVAGTLPTPDTWEVELSASKDKKTSWTRLLAEKKLGGLALLRNLRNMKEAGITDADLRVAVNDMRTDRVLPFRFISAAKYAPNLEPELEAAMMRGLDGHGRLLGHTILLIDVSGSMSAPVSSKSDLRRIDAACALAMLLREICETVEVRVFNGTSKALPPRHGFALRDQIIASLGGSTRLGAAVKEVAAIPHDRLIVISDEQSEDSVPDPVASKAYMLNVASEKNGVGYGKWCHITGWSEAVIDYAIQAENAE